MCMENENEVLFDEINSQNQEIELAMQPKAVKFKTESGLFIFLFIFSIVFLLSFYFFNIFVSPIKVVGASMQPTINTEIISDSDELHCDVVYFKDTENYEKGDIIIMTNSDQKYIASENVNYLIKRVIANGGDTIKFIPKSQSPAILANSEIYYYIEVYDSFGNKLISEETYIKEEMYYKNSEENYLNALMYDTFSQIFYAIRNGQSVEFTIPENQYFVMGDNRNNSTDSRIFGCINHEDIAGEVLLHIAYGETLIEALLQKLQTI